MNLRTKKLVQVHQVFKLFIASMVQVHYKHEQPLMKRKLISGYEIPVVGLGTWTMNDREVLLNALEYAYEAGYRHIDTAAVYGNESIIGEFLRTKDRCSMFITTKLWNTDHNRVEEACKESMQRLGVDYLDLYLIHWPVSFGSAFDLKKVWRDMEKLVYTRKVRSIGVSNFGLMNLEKLLGLCKIRPAVNQIELHPYLPQHEIRNFCAENNIVVISYSSLGSNATGTSFKGNPVITEGISLRDDPVITKIAKTRSATAEKVLLSYCVRIGCCIIPRSRSKAHIIDNLSLIDLSEEELREIENIKTRIRYVQAKSFGPNRFE